MNATYDPADDKIRIYPDGRLSETDYGRVKEAGFRWAPMQKLFFAFWNPAAEDLAMEWCGEIDDEDKTLVDRAEDRAARFETYAENREADAESARKGVERITSGIPLGQPILVGHHSERHARKDAERIENGMRKAVNMWKQSEYWKQRAHGALRNAQYKELPDVRARRIKGLEAEFRKSQRAIKAAEQLNAMWNSTEFELDHNRARGIANADWCSRCYTLAEFPRQLPVSQYEGQMSLWSALGDTPELGIVTPEQAKTFAVKVHKRTIANHERWIEHLSNRLEYEHAMLEDAGAAHLLDKKPKSAAAQLPICNYEAPEGGLTVKNKFRNPDFVLLPQVQMTRAAYAKIGSDYKGTSVVDNSHRVRTAVLPAERFGRVCVFLTDSKIHKPPQAAPKPDPVVAVPPVRVPPPVERPFVTKPFPTGPYKAMVDTLKAGVQVVVVNQLFPTPPHLAKRMCELGGVTAGQRVLEPSAGTGALVKAVFDRITGPDCGLLVAIEISPDLAQELERDRRLRVHADDYNFQIRCADFLECVDERGFDRIVMNPPFENGADIQHVQHALTMLKPGGILVGICANGPRQQAKLQPLTSTWEPLPEDTFAGTSVRAVLFTIHKTR